MKPIFDGMEQVVTYKYIFQDVLFVADTEIVLADMRRMYKISRAEGLQRGLGNIFKLNR